MNIKDVSYEISGENEKYVIGNQRRNDLYYKVAQKRVELCSKAAWKIEFASDKLGYLAEEISKHNMEDAAWFLLAASSKCEGK